MRVTHAWPHRACGLVDIWTPSAKTFAPTNAQTCAPKKHLSARGELEAPLKLCNTLSRCFQLVSRQDKQFQLLEKHREGKGVAVMFGR